VKRKQSALCASNYAAFRRGSADALLQEEKQTSWGGKTGLREVGWPGKGGISRTC